MNRPQLPHEEHTDTQTTPDTQATPPTRDLDAEHAAVMDRQLLILFIILLVMAGCFTLAWEGLQSAISQIH